MVSDLYAAAYNAHESAEAAAINAMRAELEKHDNIALMALCDPTERWETRSHLSIWVIDLANDVLSERLEEAVR